MKVRGFIAILGATVLSTVPVALAQDIPDPVLDWLSRTDASIYGDHNGWSAEIETIQPLHMEGQDTYFFQGRFSGYWADSGGNDDWTVNLGLGYRYLTPDNQNLYGANVFYDRTGDHEHQRLGGGLEWMHQYGTIRSNYYGVLSGWKTVSTGVEEKALEGFDAEIETMVPRMPWLRVKLKGYHWNAEANEDVDGFNVGFVGDLNDQMSFEAGYSVDNTDKKIWGKLTIALGPRKNVEYTAQDDFFVDELFSKRDLSIHRLDKVKRENRVFTERRSFGSSGGVRLVGA